MKRLRSILRWFAERLKDVFYDTDNEHLDGARVLAYLTIFAELWAVRHNMRLKQPIDLGPGGLGGALTGILTASAAFLVGKAWAKKKARESAAIAQNVEVAKQAGGNVVEVAPPVAAATKVAGDLKAENIEHVDVGKP